MSPIRPSPPQNDSTRPGEMSRTDITGELERFIAGQAGWRRQQGAELARATARQVGGRGGPG